MSFFESIKLVLTALPGLIKLVSSLAGWLKDTFGEDPVKAIQDQQNALKTLREAKDPHEKAQAAATLSALIRRL